MAQSLFSWDSFPWSSLEALYSVFQKSLPKGWWNSVTLIQKLEKTRRSISIWEAWWHSLTKWIDTQRKYWIRWCVQKHAHATLKGYRIQCFPRIELMLGWCIVSFHRRTITSIIEYSHKPEKTDWILPQTGPFSNGPSKKNLHSKVSINATITGKNQPIKTRA